MQVIWTVFRLRTSIYLVRRIDFVIPARHVRKV